MDTFFAFLLAGALSLYFVRGYLKKLTEKQPRPAAHGKPQLVPPKKPEAPVAACPHCGKSLAIPPPALATGPRPTHSGQA